MRLLLSPLPDSLRGPEDEAYKGRVPKRARFLEPGAATSLLGLVAAHPWLTFTDIYRSPESSLAALALIAGYGRKRISAVIWPFLAYNRGTATEAAC